MRPRYDYRFGAFLYKVRKSRGSIRHSVGAVADYEPVVFIVIRTDSLRHFEPPCGGNVGAVDIHKLHGIYVAYIRNVDAGKYFVRRHRRSKSVFAFSRRDRSAGRYHQNLFSVIVFHTPILAQKKINVYVFYIIYTNIGYKAIDKIVNSVYT